MPLTALEEKTASAPELTGGRGRALTRQETIMSNQEWFDKFASADPVAEKSAVDALEDYIRYRVREESFMDHLLTPQDLKPSEVDRQSWTNKPTKIIDLEAESPAAISVPTATLPASTWIRANRAVCVIDRIVGPAHRADVMELSTWEMDIRQVLGDQAVKDILYEKDSRLIEAVHTIVGETAGSTVFTSGTIQFQDFGGLSRDSIWEQMKIMPNTPSEFKTEKLLLNQITAMELPKFDRGEQGGDLAQDMMRNGFTETRYLNADILVTIKKALVPTGYFYHWCEEGFLGRHYVYTPTTLVVKRDGFLIEYYPYHEHGAVLANTNGLAIGQYDA